MTTREKIESAIHSWICRTGWQPLVDAIVNVIESETAALTNERDEFKVAAQAAESERRATIHFLDGVEADDMRPLDSLVSESLAQKDNEITTLTKERDKWSELCATIMAEKGAIQSELNTLREKFGKMPVYVRMELEIQRLKKERDTAQATLAANQREVSRLLDVVKGLANDKKNLTAEVERLRDATPPWLLADNVRLTAELSDSDYWRKRHLDLAESRGQQVQEIWAKCKDAEAELARVKAAIEAVPILDLVSIARKAWTDSVGYEKSWIMAMTAVRDRLLAEFDKPKLTPFPTEFAKATAAIYAEQPRPEIIAQTIGGADTKLSEFDKLKPIIRDDPDAKPQTLTEVVATIPETVQKYEAMHSPQPRPNIVLRELPLEIPKEKTWGKEGVEIAKAVLSDAAKCDKPSTDPASQFAQAVRDRIQSAGCWATDFVGQVAAEELKRLGCCMISAARLAELEAYEADAKRWRACVNRGLFPMQAFGRWHLWGQAEYLTPEAAVDAATKGGGE